MSTTQTHSCHKCGHSLQVNAKFCNNCGTSTSGIFSGGGSNTVAVSAQTQDTLFPILQEETIGDYDLYGELGRGGMAAVYLALDLALNRKVAIKTMLPELVTREGMVQRFKREAQTAAALSHPHIVQIFSVKETKRLVFFVMKYIEGRSLESVIQERGQLDVDLTRVILAQAGSALAFANRKGVIHRDVKPANIMLEEDGWAIVTDFGIAKVQEAQNLTATGTAIGTPHYMSPEQFHNKAVTGASDQYAFGVVAYEMLTGRKPFDGATYAEIITQHLFDPVPDVRAVRPDVPKHIGDAIMKMMSKEASERFADLEAAIAALGAPSQTQGEIAKTAMIQIAKEGAAQRPSMSVPMSPPPRSRPARASSPTAMLEKGPERPSTAVAKQKSSAPLWIGLAAVLLLGGVGGTAWYFKMGAGAKQAPTQVASNVPTGNNGTTGGAGPTQTPPVNNPATTAPNPAPGGPAAPDTTSKKNAKAAQTPTPSNKTAQNKPAPSTTSRSEPGAPSTTQQGTNKPDGGKKAPESTTNTPKKDASLVDPADLRVKAGMTNTVVPPAAVVSAPPPVAAPAKGSFKIRTTVDAVNVFVNDVDVGAATSTLKEFVAPVGSVHIVLKSTKPGCTIPWDSSITIKSGEATTVGLRKPVCQ